MIISMENGVEVILWLNNVHFKLNHTWYRSLRYCHCQSLLFLHTCSQRLILPFKYWGSVTNGNFIFHWGKNKKSSLMISLYPCISVFVKHILQRHPASFCVSRGLNSRLVWCHRVERESGAAKWVYCSGELVWSLCPSCTLSAPFYAPTTVGLLRENVKENQY